MMSMIEIANCETTSTLRKLMLLPCTLNSPLSVFTGWNDDMKTAGYKPEITPMKKGERNKGSNTCHFINIETESVCPETLLSQGNARYNKMKPIMIADHVITTDSVRN